MIKKSFGWTMIKFDELSGTDLRDEVDNWNALQFDAGYPVVAGRVDVIDAGHQRRTLGYAEFLVVRTHNNEHRIGINAGGDSQYALLWDTDPELDLFGRIDQAINDYLNDADAWELRVSA